MATEAQLIQGGRLLDPATGRDEIGDLLIVEGRIAALGQVEAPPSAVVRQAANLVVAPGLIDVHVHLREPGFGHKETITTGSAAAAAGGFTTVCAMPNTNPVLDRPERIADLWARAEGTACRVLPIGAATLDNRNETFADFEALREAGCVAITDDAFPLQRSEQMADALVRAAEVDLPFIAHCEVRGLSAGGAVDASAGSWAPGVSTQATLAEAAAIRLWALAYERAAARASRLPRLHLAHLSSALGVEALRALKAAEARVSAETAPHYLTLDSSAVRRFGANAKMNPPLRSPEDVAAIREALAEGTIDCLATDHAPHTPEEKALPLDQAPFGVIGLETALAVCLTALASEAPLAKLVGWLSTRPAELFGLPGGTLAVGAPADLVIFDPGARWTVSPDAFHSKGRNCPFAGREVYGRVCATFVAGRRGCGVMADGNE
jgi:dihydroorotase